MYYLLKVRADRDPTFLGEDREKERGRREDSPLIHRPEVKTAYYMPVKTRGREQQTKDPKDTSRNDSLNVSNIITSLVEANKGKLVGQARFQTRQREKDSNFDKLEEFKLFPNKKNSSIYEPRVRGEEKSSEVSQEKNI